MQTPTTTSGLSENALRLLQKSTPRRGASGEDLEEDGRKSRVATLRTTNDFEQTNSIFIIRAKLHAFDEKFGTVVFRGIREEETRWKRRRWNSDSSERFFFERCREKLDASHRRFVVTLISVIAEIESRGGVEHRFL